jgi:hypothetical protein
MRERIHNNVFHNVVVDKTTTSIKVYTLSSLTHTTLNFEYPYPLIDLDNYGKTTSARHLW